MEALDGSGRFLLTTSSHVHRRAMTREMLTRCEAYACAAGMKVDKLTVRKCRGGLDVLSACDYVDSSGEITDVCVGIEGFGFGQEGAHVHLLCGPLARFVRSRKSRRTDGRHDRPGKRAL